MKTCTTHHHACDCREGKFKEIEKENAKLKADLAEAMEILRKISGMCGDPDAVRACRNISKEIAKHIQTRTRR